MYYYAARNDKNGHRLLTSYATQKMCEKYGVGEGLKKHTGFFLLDNETGQIGPVDNVGQFNPDANEIVRSRVTNPSPKGSANGKLLIKTKNEDGVWVPTKFRGNNYGAMNTIMKALAETHKDLIIVEEVDVNQSGGIETSGDYDF